MRCPKCGSELDLKLMECERCGLATPKGKPEVSKSGRLTVPTSEKQTEKKAKWLPSFLAKSSLNKITIPSWLAIALLLIVPLFAGGYYFMNEAGVCIGCTQVGGTYTTEFTVDDEQVRLDLLLYQYGSSVTGQVRFVPQTNANDKNAKKTLFVENIDQITIREKKFFFQSKIKNNITRVQFSGLIEENNIFKGNLVVTIPELNCNGRSFAVSIKKL